MSKYRIKIETSENGAVSVRHAGNDQAYCENGEAVIVKNQPTAGWGLADLYYTDSNNTKTKITGNAFTMPSKDITIHAEFKRFQLDDWKNDNGSRPMTILGEFAMSEITFTGELGDIIYDTDSNNYMQWDGDKWAVMGSRYPMEVRTSIGQSGIVPNVLYMLGEVGSLNITTSATLETGKENTYHLIMKAGADFTLKVPGEWVWENGTEPRVDRGEYIRIDATVVSDTVVLASYHIYAAS